MRKKATKHRAKVMSEHKSSLGDVKRVLKSNPEEMKHFKRWQDMKRGYKKLNSSATPNLLEDLKDVSRTKKKMILAKESEKVGKLPQRLSPKQLKPISRGIIKDTWDSLTLSPEKKALKKKAQELDKIARNKLYGV